MKAYFNDRERIECNGVEFRSGDVVQVLIGGEWQVTRIEHNGYNYYSIDGYELVGNEVKHI